MRCASFQTPPAIFAVFGNGWERNESISHCWNALDKNRTWLAFLLKVHLTGKTYSLVFWLVRFCETINDAGRLRADSSRSNGMGKIQYGVDLAVPCMFCHSLYIYTCS